MISLLDNLAEDRAKNFNRFIVELEFRDKIFGGHPRDAELLRNWIISRLNKEAKDAVAKGLDPPSEERREEIIQSHMERMFGEDMEDTIESEEQRSWTTFNHDAIGPYIESYQLNAMFREMGTTTGLFFTKRGSKQTYQHLMDVRSCGDDGEMFSGERSNKIHFMRDDGWVREPDGHVNKCLHTMGPSGPINALKRHDFIQQARIRFAVVLPARLKKSREKAVLDGDDLLKMLLHAEGNGLGACRSQQGIGNFTLIRLDQVDDNPWVVQ